MNDVINVFLSSIIVTGVQFFAASKIMATQLMVKKNDVYAVYFLLTLITTILFLLTDNFWRVLIIAIILTFSNKFLFKQEWNKVIITTFLINTLFAISEIIFAIFFEVVLWLDVRIDGQNYFGSMLANIFISIVVLLFLNNPFCVKILRKMSNNTLNSNKYLFLIISIFGVTISAILIYGTYYKFSTVGLLLVVLLLIFIYGFIIYKLFYEKNMKELAQNKNNLLIDNIYEYEKVIEVQKMESHENKNQLRIIKGMLLEDENKEACDYISELLKEKSDKDKTLLERVKDIPNGGLRALIYSKLSPLSEEFKICLSISRTINSKTLDMICPSLNVDMCKVLGVFLDNAIEASSEAPKKVVGVELFCEENKFYIIISNSFTGNIDVEKMMNTNYSSKGVGHGYGLLLAKSIITNNKHLTNKIKINGNIFSQTLIIDLNL